MYNYLHFDISILKRYGHCTGTGTVKHINPGISIEGYQQIIKPVKHETSLRKTINFKNGTKNNTLLVI